MPYTIEIRKAEGGKPFTMNETGEKAGQIMGAVAAGSASVLVGGVTAMGSLQGGPQKGYDTAGQLMNTAGEGRSIFGSWAFDDHDADITIWTGLPRGKGFRH